jgi:hypothetical protein
MFKNVRIRRIVGFFVPVFTGHHRKAALFVPKEDLVPY